MAAACFTRLVHKADLLLLANADLLFLCVVNSAFCVRLRTVVLAADDRWIASLFFGAHAL
jgi:hypothetical protein